MCIRNRMVSLMYKSVLVILCGYGIFLNSGLADGRFSTGIFRYYTIQSNILVFIFFLCAAIACAVDIGKKGIKGASTFAPGFKGAVTMAIAVTMLIYMFILSGTPFSMFADGGRLGNILVHFVVPLMAIADYALFDRKGRLQPGDPLTWVVIPYLYYAFALVYAQLGGSYPGGSRFPYGFIDVDRLGWPQVLINVGMLTAGFLALGYIVFGIDRLLGVFLKKKAPPQPERRAQPAPGQPLAAEGPVAPPPAAPGEAPPAPAPQPSPAPTQYAAAAPQGAFASPPPAPQPQPGVQQPAPPLFGQAAPMPLQPPLPHEEAPVAPQAAAAVPPPPEPAPAPAGEPPETIEMNEDGAGI